MVQNQPLGYRQTWIWGETLQMVVSQLCEQTKFTVSGLQVFHNSQGQKGQPDVFMGGGGAGTHSYCVCVCVCASFHSGETHLCCSSASLSELPQTAQNQQELQDYLTGEQMLGPPFVKFTCHIFPKITECFMLEVNQCSANFELGRSILSVPASAKGKQPIHCHLWCFQSGTPRACLTFLLALPTMGDAAHGQGNAKRLHQARNLSPSVLQVIQKAISQRNLHSHLQPK